MSRLLRGHLTTRLYPPCPLLPASAPAESTRHSWERSSWPHWLWPVAPISYGWCSLAVSATNHKSDVLFHQWGPLSALPSCPGSNCACRRLGTTCPAAAPRAMPRTQCFFYSWQQGRLKEQRAYGKRLGPNPNQLPLGLPDWPWPL